MKCFSGFTFLCLILLLALPAHAATYYVAPSGSDSNSGAAGSPWLTIGHSTTNTITGDTVLIAAGIYNERDYSGAAGVTFRCTGAVTNNGWGIGHSEVVVDGFTVTGAPAGWNGACINLGYATHNVSVLNCKLINIGVATYGIMIPASGLTSDTGPHGCIISNVLFFNGTTTNGNRFLDIEGSNTLIVACGFFNMPGHDAIDITGAGHTIRSCVFSNIVNVDGAMDHADIIQCWGITGAECHDIVFERNFITDCACGLTQLTQDGVDNIRDWTYRNNIVVRNYFTASIDIPGFKAYNNTFYQCCKDLRLPPLAFGIGGANGYATNCQVFNNAFIDCAGWYSFVPVGGYTMTGNENNRSGYNFFSKNGTSGDSDFVNESPNSINGGDPNVVGPQLRPMAGSFLIDAGTNLSGLVSNDFEGNARPQGSAFDIGAFEYNGSGQTSAQPVAPSLTAQPQSATVNVAGTATFSVAATGTAPLSYQWQFNGANITGVVSSAFTKNSVQASDAGSYSVVVANAAGSVTSASAVLTVTTANVPPSLTAQPQSQTVNAGNTATFSVTATGTAPLSYQWRFGGANVSGATGSTYARPAVQSADAGNYSVVVANAAGSVTSADAPLTVTSSVGSPTDSSLKLHLDFDEDFSSGQVLDTSGNGNDGWQFNPTNRITPTPGVLGGTAAQFSSPGTYLAVTNLEGFAYLTNGTISLWAKFAPNGDLTMRLLDNGYVPAYAGNPAAASNSWALCRDYTPNLTFLVYPPGGARQQVVTWPDDTDRQTLSTAGFHLYSVTVDCPSNRVIAYYDGNPWMTNSINLPWIRIYGCAGQPWLCIGAASSDGTPQWGDDAYPDSGFFAGSLDDLRIYNRTLPAADVKALYTGRPTPRPPLALRILNP